MLPETNPADETAAPLCTIEDLPFGPASLAARNRYNKGMAGILLCLLAVAALLVGCMGSVETPSPPADPPVAPPPLEVVQLAGGFAAPVDLQQPGDNSGRMFVVERGGRIRILRTDGTVVSGAYVDIAAARGVVTDGENGLLGLAFHPNYGQNGCFYVNYTTRRNGRLQTIIAEYRATPPSANTASTTESILMTIDQPDTNHKGGALAFSPNDGFLYIALGDGGGSGDTFMNGQNVRSRLGKILRVSAVCGGGSGRGNAYTVPSSNPFFGQGEPTDEIWALGLRNPWRMSFDRSNGRLWVGDVGQNRFEEIDMDSSNLRGANLGWNVMEGFQCFSPSTGCNMSGLTPPIFAYDRSQGDEAVTGGYVYRGTRIPNFAAAYVFGDFISGRVWSLAQNAQGNWVRTELLSVPRFQLASFGQDTAGEIYVLQLSAGTVSRLRAVGGQ